MDSSSGNTEGHVHVRTLRKHKATDATLPATPLPSNGAVKNSLLDADSSVLLRSIAEDVEREALGPRMCIEVDAAHMDTCAWLRSSTQSAHRIRQSREEWLSPTTHAPPKSVRSR
jgi:hypothetical protein